MRGGIPPCCTLIPGLRSSGAVPRADGDSKDPTSPEAGLSLSCSHDPERLQLPVQDSELAQHRMGCPMRTHKVINELPRGTDTFVFDRAHAKTVTLPLQLYSFLPPQAACSRIYLLLTIEQLNSSSAWFPQ